MKLFEHNESLNDVIKLNPKVLSALSSMQIFTLSDLISHLPRRIEDRSSLIPLSDTQEYANTKIKIIDNGWIGSFYSKKTFKALAQDEYNGKIIELLCFNRDYLSNKLKIGSTYYFYGKLGSYNQNLQSTAFNIFDIKDDIGYHSDFLPIYKLSEEISQTNMKSAIKKAYALVKKLEDEIPSYLRDKFNIFDINTSIKEAHFPSSLSNFEKAIKSLKITELFYFLLATTKRIKPIKTLNITYTKRQKAYLDSLKHITLTNDQNRVISEIQHDLNSKIPMNRLLQGDVGSGKTLVAIMAALLEIDKGNQVALMVPTEILAFQHYNNISKALENIDVKTQLLTSSSKNKKEILQDLKSKKIDFLIGTHSLSSDSVEFSNLSLVIIDEQHRFGVKQREKLIEKAINPNHLSMSATPIPRTLILSYYKNMNISSIYELPKGRIPIKTTIVKEASRLRMYRSIKKEFQRNHQAYFIFPRIDEDERTNLRDVISMFERLKEIYPEYEGRLIHGKIEDEEKSEILKGFSNNEFSYLVATSVVEVGLDVPNATCIVIEHANIFGLASLHQLRGRVGRSNLNSYCFLVYSDDNLTEDGKARLKTMRASNDGFFIADSDLRIRGPGQIDGIKQSGAFKNNKFSSLIADIDLMQEIFPIVKKLLEVDPYLNLYKQHKVIKDSLDKNLWFNIGYIN